MNNELLTEGTEVREMVWGRQGVVKDIQSNGLVRVAVHGEIMYRWPRNLVMVPRHAGE